MTMTTRPASMRPLDLLLYLFGHRRAIERIAATPSAILVGAILVLSAGLARNYDHLDLLQQPSWFLGPFIASLVSTFFIWLWLLTGLNLNQPKQKINDTLTFLNLIWLTAPCAWLYAIPVEMYTDLTTATKWNIAFLAIVALWRVAIIVRAVTILSGAPWFRVTLLVMAPASCEMLVGSFFKSLSLIGIMGGVRLPPHQELLREATGFTAGASFWIFIASCILLFFIKGRAITPLNRDKAGIPRTAIITSVIFLLSFIALAIPFQSALQNRHQLEKLIAANDYTAAIAFASARQRSDFPAIHYLAPSPDDYNMSYPLEPLDMLPANAPQWLRDEWTHNAIVAVTSSVPRSEEDWKTIQARHPKVLAALNEQARILKEKPSLTHEEEFWLRSYKRYKPEFKKTDTPSNENAPSPQE